MPTHSEHYSKLPLAKKIGQLFFIGIPGEEIDESTAALLGDIAPGGICLFARNLKNAIKTRKLTDDLRARLPYTPFLSLDQEGGLVDRLRRIVEPMPSALEVSKDGDINKAETLARITAETVRILGFNMNFAPVADVIDQSRAGFVMSAQMRNFGCSAAEAAKFTVSYLEALQAGGCLGCIKHFPGIGGVECDPHEELPAVECGKSDLFETDLFPYIEHLKNGNVEAIMTGHTVFPSLDLQETDSSGKLLPSSLSHNIVTGLMRDELGFDNLALTDDLEMGAIVSNYGIGTASVMSFQAGNDFILICNDPAAIYEGFEALLKAAVDGLIGESRIDQSLERIWRVREKLNAPLGFSESRLEELSNEIRDLKDSIVSSI